MCITYSRIYHRRELTRGSQSQQNWTLPAPPSSGPPVYAYQQPQHCGSEKPVYNAPPPPPQQVYVTPQAAPGPVDPKKNKFGKLGGRMGTVSPLRSPVIKLDPDCASDARQAVASGAGFGLGAGLMVRLVSHRPGRSRLTFHPLMQSEAVHGIFN